MPPTYYPPVDPGGGASTAQKASTAASALGFVALVGSGAGGGDPASAALGVHFPQILTSGFSFAGMGSSSLFTVGLILVAVGIVLNLISLGLRSRQPLPSYGDAATASTAGAVNPAPTHQP